MSQILRLKLYFKFLAHAQSWMAQSRCLRESLSSGRRRWDGREREVSSFLKITEIIFKSTILKIFQKKMNFLKKCKLQPKVCLKNLSSSNWANCLIFRVFLWKVYAKFPAFPNKFPGLKIKTH